MAITMYHAYLDGATTPTLLTVGKEIKDNSDGSYSYTWGSLTPNTKHTIALAAWNGNAEGPKTDVISVTTNSVPVNGITIAIAKTMTIGQSIKATITIDPANATDKTITWNSSDTTLATVGTDGTVKALKVGTVTITATSANGKIATAEITIYEALVNVVGLKSANVTTTSFDVTWTTTPITA